MTPGVMSGAAGLRTARFIAYPFPVNMSDHVFSRWLARLAALPAALFGLWLVVVSGAAGQGLQHAAPAIGRFGVARRAPAARTLRKAPRAVRTRVSRIRFAARLVRPLPLRAHVGRRLHGVLLPLLC